MSRISPCLWFDGNAEEAAQLYTSLFPNSTIDKVTRSPADNPSTPRGAVLTVDFTLDGQRFIGLNGGPAHPFTEAISFSIDCEDQAEVDGYWDALIADGGAPDQCGWLKDRFGVSWQIVPAQLGEMMADSKHGSPAKAMEALLKMKKLDIAALQAAYKSGT